VDVSRSVDQFLPAGFAGAFGALADPVRLAVVRELLSGTACSCELAPRLGMAQSLLSYHLRILREAGLIEGRRRGRRTEYHVRRSALRELAVGLVDLAIGGKGHDD
jgi:ArsR family transcriptional regulator